MRFLLYYSIEKIIYIIYQNNGPDFLKDNHFDNNIMKEVEKALLSFLEKLNIV